MTNTQLNAAIRTVPAIGYIRVSTWYEDKISDEIQKTAILEWAKRHHRHIVDWVIDLDATGRNFRRKIMKAIAAVEEGTAEEIICWKYSRFGRNRHGVAINLARIEKVGGQLQSATEEIDASTAVGEFTRDMLFAIASFESNRAGEQWREIHDYRRELGLPATGGKRFGYIWTPRLDPEGNPQEEGYDPDPERHLILGDLYERYADGQGFYSLAGLLNDGGHLNTRGARWAQAALTRSLDSGFGAGLILSHRRDIRCGDRSSCQRWIDHYAHLPAAHTSVISDDLWAAYQKRRDQRRSLPPRARVASYPLSGLVRCGRCGGTASVGSKTGHPGYSYQCSRKFTRKSDCPGTWMKRSKVEAAVYAWLVGMREEIDELIAGRTVISATPKRPDTAKRREKLAADVARFSAALDNASAALALGDMPRPSYLRTRDKLQQQIAECEGEMAMLVDAGHVEQGPMPYRVQIEGLLEEWDTMPVVRLRDALADIVRVVVLHPHQDPEVVIDPRWAPVAD